MKKPRNVCVRKLVTRDAISIFFKDIKCFDVSCRYYIFFTKQLSSRIMRGYNLSTRRNQIKNRIYDPLQKHSQTSVSYVGRRPSRHLLSEGSRSLMSHE